MRGDLIVNKQRMTNIDVYSMRDAEHIQVYRENEDGAPTEYFSLIDARVYINHDRLELSGYQFIGEEKKIPKEMPLQEEEYRYLTVHFYPYGQQKKPDDEYVYDTAHNYLGKTIRG